MLTALSFIGVFMLGAMVGAAFVYRKSQGLFMINKSLRINYDFLCADNNELKNHYLALLAEYNSTMDRMFDLPVKCEIDQIINTKTGDK